MALVEIWFIIIALMLIGGVVLRLWTHQLPPVELHKVSGQVAPSMVAEFLLSCYDGQFGFPSGLFSIETIAEHEVVATEIIGKGSHFTAILSGLYRAVLGISGCFGCIGSIVALSAALVITPALLYAALTEMTLKYLLRSRIVASLTPAGDGTAVAFGLRGPVALLVGRRLRQAFDQPELPVRVSQLAGIPGVGAAR